VKKLGIPYQLVSAATNNAQIVRGAPGQVTAVWCTNTNAAIRFLKFFDVARIPEPANDRPVFICGIPGGGAAGAGGSIAIPGAICFDNGIGIAIVTGAADGDNSAVAAGEIVVGFVIR